MDYYSASNHQPPPALPFQGGGNDTHKPTQMA